MGLGSDSVEGDRRLLGDLRRTLGDSEEEGLRVRGGGSESEEGGRRGLRTRALGGSGGLRARALGLGGGSESEEGSRTFLGFRLGAGALGGWLRIRGRLPNLLGLPLRGWWWWWWGWWWDWDWCCYWDWGGGFRFIQTAFGSTCLSFFRESLHLLVSIFFIHKAE